MLGQAGQRDEGAEAGWGEGSRPPKSCGGAARTCIVRGSVDRSGAQGTTRGSARLSLALAAYESGLIGCGALPFKTTSSPSHWCGASWILSRAARRLAGASEVIHSKRAPAEGDRAARWARAGRGWESLGEVGARGSRLAALPPRAAERDPRGPPAPSRDRGAPATPAPGPAPRRSGPAASAAEPRGRGAAPVAFRGGWREGPPGWH